MQSRKLGENGPRKIGGRQVWQEGKIKKTTCEDLQGRDTILCGTEGKKLVKVINQGRIEYLWNETIEQQRNRKGGANLRTSQ